MDKNTKAARVLSSYQVFAIVCNVLVVIMLLVLFIVFEKLISPFHRGFFCDDESIMKPYKTKQTISIVLVTCLAVIFILIAVIGCDCINRYLSSEKKKTAVMEPSVVARRFRLKQWVYLMIIRVVLGMVGLGFCMILIGMAKVMLGRLRPHFLDVCKPDLSNCTGRIFYDFSECTVRSGKAFEEARKSFPSGHSGAAGYAVFFFALYVEYTIRPQLYLLLKPFVQFTVVFGGVAIALTRISDYFHHWSDVLAGLLIGASFAYYTIFRLIELPKYYPVTKAKENIPDEMLSCIGASNNLTSYDAVGITSHGQQSHQLNDFPSPRSGGSS